MVDKKEFGDFETAWCPGCGNFGILNSLKKALAACDISPARAMLVSGIGQAAKTPHYLRANVFNGLHGRSLPVALGLKMANPQLTVIAESGDGCMYGEGGNHFLAAIRRNADLTILVHDNRIYGLTKGQASPTSAQGMTTKAQPHGNPSSAFNPLAVAIVMGCGFVARGYVGQPNDLTELMCRAIRHRGTSLLDIFQPCVSFNHVNTYNWFKEHCYQLAEDYDPGDFNRALNTALNPEDKLALGVIYEKTSPVFEEHFAMISGGTPLNRQPTDYEVLQEIIDGFAV
jgi:2-oxoglutarate ferredoxin oxidoreductase subunit beta